MSKLQSFQDSSYEQSKPIVSTTDSDVLLRLIILMVVMVFGYLFLDSSSTTSSSKITLSDEKGDGG